MITEFSLFGLRISIYFCFHILGFVFAVIYTALMLKKFGIKKPTGVVFIVFCYVTFYAVMLILYFVCVGVFGGKNTVRAFVFLPLIVCLYAKAFNIKISKAQDFVAPIPLLAHGISRIGCIFSGCCKSWWQLDCGIYNNATRTKLFPVQLVEAGVSIAICVLLVYILKKHNYNMGGRCMPIMLILFGSTRFLLEFLRDNTKLFWNMSELALWAIGMTVVGAIWLIIQYLISKKISNDNELTLK